MLGQVHRESEATICNVAVSIRQISRRNSSGKDIIQFPCSLVICRECYRIGSTDHQVYITQEILNGIKWIDTDTALSILISIITLRERIEYRTIEFKHRCRSRNTVTVSRCDSCSIHIIITSS